jgi:hypothetical protein
VGNTVSGYLNFVLVTVIVTVDFDFDFDCDITALYFAVECETGTVVTIVELECTSELTGGVIHGIVVPTEALSDGSEAGRVMVGMSREKLDEALLHLTVEA